MSHRPNSSMVVVCRLESQNPGVAQSGKEEASAGETNDAAHIKAKRPKSPS
jgi:hypothetical protein